MSKQLTCHVGTISSYFADHAIATIKSASKETLVVLSEHTNYLSPAENNKVFAAMREGMTVNLFFDGEPATSANLVHASPNLK